MLEAFLSKSDAARALSALCKLMTHDIQAWALTGGLAVEWHALRYGSPPEARALNDLDFVTESFDCVPSTLSRDFLFRHVHPADAPGRTMLQCVDAENKVRIDVFRAAGGTLRRSSRMETDFGAIRVVSAKDLLARAARLTLDVADGIPTPGKHARDFQRLDSLLESENIEMVWSEHRKKGQPASFDEVRSRLRGTIAAHPELLTVPAYAGGDELCPRCAPRDNFRLASASEVKAILGYC
jgi:hypothetical protein